MVITVALNTSHPGIENNLHKMTDQDFSCNGCLIPCMGVYLRAD